VRSEKFDARNAFDFNPKGKSPFNRQQYGGFFGGPISHDKTFFFASIERLSQEKTTFINLLTDPTLFQVTTASQNATVRNQAALFDFIAGSAAPDALTQGAAQLRAALTTTTYPRTVKLFTAATGQFPFDDGQTQCSARLDHDFRCRATGSLRFNPTGGVFESRAAGSLIAGSRGLRLDPCNCGLLPADTVQFHPTPLNVLSVRVIFARRHYLLDHRRAVQV